MNPKKDNIKKMKILEKVYVWYYYVVLAWIGLAFSLQMYFTYVHFTGESKMSKKIAAELSKQPW